MVGVPGKYKGCNTCRLRRVKCDNERPFCRKCLDSGRQCGGYQRETTFIIGTIEDGGRCSSHPPRIVRSSKKAKAAAKVEEEEKLELLLSEPLGPAWDDTIILSNLGATYCVQLGAFHTNLQLITREIEDEFSSKFRLVTFPLYEPAPVRPRPQDEDFNLQAQCLIHLAPLEEAVDDEPGSRVNSICLFLYQHNENTVFRDEPPWRDDSIPANTVRQLGPGNFQVFPNHHFFVRVYRVSAVCTAIINRRSIFLSGPEWTTTPWEFHPKSEFDRLLDVVVLMPSLLSRADRIFPKDPTLARRLAAQDLLGNFIRLESQIEAWYSTVSSNLEDDSQLFWIEEAGGLSAQIPFSDTFGFRDNTTSMMFIYYWMVLVVLYPCIERLHDTIFQPVVDTFPQVFPSLPAHLQLSLAKYGVKEVRELAARLCRSLDFALNTTVQPDMLVVPLFVVQEFYKEINASAGDGQLELMWCEAFRLRLVAKGQFIADEVIQPRKWQELGQY